MTSFDALKKTMAIAEQTAIRHAIPLSVAAWQAGRRAHTGNILDQLFREWWPLSEERAARLVWQFWQQMRPHLPGITPEQAVDEFPLIGVTGAGGVPARFIILARFAVWG